MKKNLLTMLTLAALVTLGSTAVEAGCRDSATNKSGRTIALFNKMDLDGNGVVTLDEAKSQREARFKEADTDGDGTLSLPEFKVMKEKKREAKMQKKLLKMDKNSDGKVSMEEFVNYKRLFERMDGNDDNTITQDEVKNYYGKQHHGFWHHGQHPFISNWGNPIYTPGPWNGYGPWNQPAPMGWSTPGWGYGPYYR